MNDNKKIEKNKRISIRLPEHKHMEIKLAATSLGITIKAFVENALYNYSETLKSNQEEES